MYYPFLCVKMRVKSYCVRLLQNERPKVLKKLLANIWAF